MPRFLKNAGAGIGKYAGAGSNPTPKNHAKSLKAKKCGIAGAGFPQNPAYSRSLAVEGSRSRAAPLRSSRLRASAPSFLLLLLPLHEQNGWMEWMKRLCYGHIKNATRFLQKIVCKR